MKTIEKEEHIITMKEIDELAKEGIELINEYKLLVTENKFLKDEIAKFRKEKLNTLKDKEQKEEVKEEERIWSRDRRKCRRCHRLVYRTASMSCQGTIHYVNGDKTDQVEDNLLLLCLNCRQDLERLRIEYPRKYLCLMEIITRSKLQVLRDKTPDYAQGYRHSHILNFIDNREREHKVLYLPLIEKEQLVYLRLLKAKVEAKRMKVEENKVEEV